MTPEDLDHLHALVKQGYRHRSKVLRMIVRQFDDASIQALQPYAAEPARPDGRRTKRMVTVSLAMQLTDLRKLDQWTADVPFSSRSALVRAMIRWAHDEGGLA